MATFGVIRRITRDRPIVIVTSFLVLGAVAFYLARPSRRTATLRISAGSARGQRHAMAEILKAEALAHRVRLVLVPTSGSEDALARLEAGQLDLAMIQGGLAFEPGRSVREVAALHVEPMHLLVKGDLYADVSRNLDALRGRSVNLGSKGSGTRVSATEILRFAGLRPERDFRATGLSYEELENATDGRLLPDAVFMVSLLPSPIVKRLVSRHGYRLVALPFAEAFSLSTPDPAEVEDEATDRVPARHDHVTDVVVPPYTYGVRPAVPEESIHTLGLRMLLVARKDADAEAVARVLETVFTTSFSQLAHPPLSTTLLDLPPELTIHPGTLVYQERSKPLITGDVIDAFEKELSIAGALLGAAFFFWQWLKSRYRRLRESGFEHYILRVAEIEEKALLSSTVGSEAWNSRDLKSRPH